MWMQTGKRHNEIRGVVGIFQWEGCVCVMGGGGGEEGTIGHTHRSYHVAEEILTK